MIFPEQLPHGPLREVLPEIWMVSGQSRPNFNGNQMQFSRNMIIVRHGDALTLIHSLRMDDTGLAALESLGAVAGIVRLGGFHGRDDAFYLDRYDAPLWAAPGTPFERGETARDLTPGGPQPVEGASTFIHDTETAPEAVLHLDRHGGILIGCDSLQNWAAPDEWFDEPTAAGMKQMGFFRPANVGPGWRSFANPKPENLAKLRDFSFRHLLSAHGAPLLNDAEAALDATLKEEFGV
ncbi:MAG: hypothetical protein AAF401_06175 [Pseudomonadota bacterium]